MNNATETYLDRYPVTTANMNSDQLAREATRLEGLQISAPLDRIDSARLSFCKQELRTRGAI